MYEYILFNLSFIRQYIMSNFLFNECELQCTKVNVVGRGEQCPPKFPHSIQGHCYVCMYHMLCVGTQSDSLKFKMTHRVAQKCPSHNHKLFKMYSLQNIFPSTKGWLENGTVCRKTHSKNTPGDHVCC